MLYKYWKYSFTGNRMQKCLFEAFVTSWKANNRLFKDRRYFYETFKVYTGFEMFTREELINKPFLLEYVYSKNLDYVFLKKKNTQDGKGLIKQKLDSLHPKTLLQYMKKDKFEYLEFPLHQDKSLDQIAPKGINTINVLCYSDDEFTGKILATSLQLSSFSCFDCMGMGGIWVNLDSIFGYALGEGTQIFPKKKFYRKHPLTSCSINNISINKWDALVNEVFLIHSRKGLRGLYTFEMVLQDGKAKLLDLHGIDSIPFWLSLGNMDLVYEILPI